MGLSRRDAFGVGASSLVGLSAMLTPARLSAADDLGSGAGDLWGPFAQGVAACGDVLSQEGVPASDTEQAEGARLLGRYLRLGLDFCLEYADPAYPAFFEGTRDGVRKYAGDNPDEVYSHASVSPDYAYRVSGSMEGAFLFECGVYTGDAFLDPKKNPVRLLDFITESDVEIAPDGSFELFVGGPKRDANWVPLAPGASGLLVRRYRKSPFVDYPRLRIERLDNPGAPPLLTPAEVGRRMGLAAQWARANASLWAQYVSARANRQRNILTGFEDDGELGAPGGHKYLNGFWSVQPGQALVLTFRPPDAAYWQLVICNYWMESLEWRFGNDININNFNVRIAEDGSATFAISHEKPRGELVNWLEPQGHTMGTMCLRAARTKGALPIVTTRLVPSDQV